MYRMLADTIQTDPFLPTAQSSLFLTFSCMYLRPRLRSALFPYTTLFRSNPAILSPSRVKMPSDSPLNTLEDQAKCVCTVRSEEHTSELQSRGQLVCRLLLEKKKR